MSKTTTAAVTMIAAAGMTLGIAASAGASTMQHPVCNTPVPSGDTYHVIPRGTSFAIWANRHGGGTGNVLSATIQCGPGIQQLSFFKFLDRAHLWARVQQNTGVWVPFGDWVR